MSEYQYYEFVAIDRPLTAGQQSEVRSLSTRAHITATKFTNDYQWGNFRGDPARMMERYYDAHVYVTNWGTNQLMLRVPTKLLDATTVQPYLCDEKVEAWATSNHLILDFHSEDDSADLDTDPEGWLSALLGVRAELASGDLRPLYLAWLAAIGTWEHDEEAFDGDFEAEPEPPVPAGLGSLTAAQQALADFLRLDTDLIKTAAANSPERTTPRTHSRQLARWVEGLPEKERNALLVRVANGEPGQVHLELLRRFHSEIDTDSVRDTTRRTVADLLDAAAAIRQERERHAAAKQAEARARRERGAAQAREEHLQALTGEQETAWERVATMIASRKPAEYDAAVALLTDLKIVHERTGRLADFTRRLTGLRQEHLRKPSLISRLDGAGLKTPRNPPTR